MEGDRKRIFLEKYERAWKLPGSAKKPQLALAKLNKVAGLGKNQRKPQVAKGGS